MTRIAVALVVVLVGLSLFLGFPRRPVAAEVEHGVVPGQYLVVLKGDEKPPGRAAAMARQYGGDLLRDYRIINGFAARIPLGSLGALLADPDVRLVEADGIAWASEKGAGSGKGGSKPPPEQPEQSVPSGVSRIGADLNPNEADGIRVAVVDTGIDLDHPDLAENVKGGATFVSRTKSADDDNGHGTHVAGTIAAVDNAIGVVGVASRAWLYAVKVLDRRGSGSYSDVIAGVDWATQNGMHVINMSLGGSVPSEALHTALLNAKLAGIVTVVAAGNSGTSAAEAYPAAYDDAVLTVSALDPADDTFPSWSNFGVPPIDLAGPGVGILSTYKGAAYTSLSGTSMATPHVAGAAALAIRTWFDTFGSMPTPDQIREKLTATATAVSGNTEAHPEPLVGASGL